MRIPGGFRNFFGSQFLGAFNDNFFKVSLLWMIAATNWEPSTKSLASYAANLFFILPFLLFSTFAGQLSDRHSKSTVIQQTKLAEIGIMMVAVLGFWLQSVPLLLTVLFFMGAQSAFFSPAKYAIVPELVPQTSIIAANGWLEFGTFLSILLGTLIAGPVLDLEGEARYLVSAGVLIIALAGYGFARSIPDLSPAQPDKAIDWNIIRLLLHALKPLKHSALSMAASCHIAWFWFVGSALQLVVIRQSEARMSVSATVGSMLLGGFCIGVALGSALASRWSHQEGETSEVRDSKQDWSLAKMGVAGLSLGLFALALLLVTYPTPAEGHIIGPEIFFQSSHVWLILVSMIWTAASAAMYSVPLYTRLQLSIDESRRGELIAASNVLNAASMITSAAFLMLFPILRIDAVYSLGVMSIFSALVFFFMNKEPS